MKSYYFEKYEIIICNVADEPTVRDDIGTIMGVSQNLISLGTNLNYAEGYEKAY